MVTGPSQFRSSNLTDQQREEARQLRVRMATWKESTGGTQASFAKDYKFPGGASMISQNLKELRPISIDQARAYMRGFNCTLDEISPTLAQQFGGMMQGTASISMSASGTLTAQTSVTTLEDGLMSIARALLDADALVRIQAKPLLQHLIDHPQEAEKVIKRLTTLLDETQLTTETRDFIHAKQPS